MKRKAPTEVRAAPEAAAAEAPSLALVAKEVFGDKFYGVVSEPNADPDPAESERDEDEADPVVEPETEEGEEEVEVSSLSELASHFGRDDGWVSGLKVSVKVDGKPYEAPIGDLVASYQMTQAAEQRLSEAKTKAKEISDAAAHKAQALEQHFAVAASLITEAEKALDADVGAVNWASLREDDPAEYSARKADFSDRRAKIDKMKDAAVASYQEAARVQVEEARKGLGEYIEQQRKMLLDKIPEWRDPVKAKAGNTKLVEFLLKSGFSKEEIASAYDHRLIVIAHKAMLSDETQANTNAAKKRVITVPKVIKPGGSKSQDKTLLEQEAALKARLKQTGRLEDAVALRKFRAGVAQNGRTNRNISGP